MLRNVWSSCGLSTAPNELSSFVWKPKNLKVLRNLKNLKSNKTENSVFPRVFEFFRNLKILIILNFEIFEISEKL